MIESLHFKTDTEGALVVFLKRNINFKSLLRISKLKLADVLALISQLLRKYTHTLSVILFFPRPASQCFSEPRKTTGLLRKYENENHILVLIINIRSPSEVSITLARKIKTREIYSRSVLNNVRN